MIRLFILICLLNTLVLYSQQTVKTPYPNSVLDFGIGAGTNHGIMGAQAVIGPKGNGLLVAVGPLGWQAGVQVSYRWIFASFSYGVYGFYTENTNLRRTYPIVGYIALAGTKINLGRRKKLYLQLAGGYAYWGYAYVPHIGRRIHFNTLTYDIGLGYRLSFGKKPSINAAKIR